MPLAIVFTNPGNYTIEDDGIRGNNTSVIRDGSGVVITTFVHPADTLTFSTSVPGVNLTFNVGDSFGPANVNVGQLGDLAASPDSIVVKAMRTDGFMTLVSDTTITEGGSDASADIIAAAIVLSAVNGIGTPTNALELQTTFLEAETDNGGINLSNYGQVQIGGITSQVDGLDVTTSGNLNFTNTGFIYLSDTSGPSTVHGGDISGNVTLTAIGVDADIYAPIDHPSIYAPGGGITLNAGRNVWFGPGGANYNNDILATGTIRITAGAEFKLDGTSDIRTGAFGGVVGGDIIITAGRTINLDNTTGGLQTIQAFAGDVILTTGPGGAFIENAAFPGAINTTDDIILNTDNAEIFSGGLNTTGIGSITIRPVTPGLLIDLGSAAISLPGTLALSDAEFDLLFTLNVNIGDADSGNVTFSAPLSPFIVADLTVQGGNDILFNSSLVLPGTLTLRAGDDLHIGPAASFTSSGGGFTAFVDDAQNDGGTGGLGALDGVVTVATTIHLNGNLDADTLRGSAAADILMGNGGNDTLRSFGGADLLNGGLGSDHMEGGLGDDTYIIDNAGDVVFEAPVEGLDTVRSSISYGLGADVENLTLTGATAINGTGNNVANTIIGNGAANTLNGLDGFDTLNGRAGADTMNGGTGNDKYIVDNGSDQAVEAAAAGTDTVDSSATFTLGANLENLTLTGGAAIDGTGNTAANILTGNGADNTLTGLGGNDTLDGGGGDDTMVGGLGNDTFIVGQSGDVASENSGQGTDLVQSSITFTLGANVEELTLTGAANINGTGNTLANELIGNTGNNILDGKAGADTMKGGLGNDTYVVDNADDVTTELAGQGTDTVQAAITFTLASQFENLTLTGAGNINGTGNTIVNTLLGNGGDNILDGKLGADTMEGGAGDDTYVVDNAGDIANELAGQGTDTVTASKTYTIANNIENLTLTGASNISGTGNVLANILTGNGANNTLSGLGGDDQINGGSGDDDIFGGTGNDELTGGSGADKFRFDTALSAATNVDDLLGYSGANDTILLDRDIFTGIAANGVLAASAFVNGTSAGDANDRIIYNSATGNIFYDADGNGAGAQIRFAIVADGTSLTSADFSAYL